MFRFLLYSIIVIVIVSGIYIFLSDVGNVSINTDFLYIDTSVTTLLALLLIIVLVFALFVHFIFWLISIPSKVKNLHNHYSHRKKMEKLFNLICIVESKNEKKIRHMYSEKMFLDIEHPIVDLVRGNDGKLIGLAIP